MRRKFLQSNSPVRVRRLVAHKGCRSWSDSQDNYHETTLGEAERAGLLNPHGGTVQVSITHDGRDVSSDARGRFYVMEGRS